MTFSERKLGKIGMRRLAGVAVSVLIVGAAIAAYRPSHDVGYVEIKTVPVAAFTRAAFYLDAAKLAPIRNGSAILRERVGTLKLEGEGFSGTLAPLCDIVVAKNRITTVTVSVLDRPPRCQCRYRGTDARGQHACVS